jgi:hypothetical protein
LKTILNWLLILALSIPFQALAADPPAGGPQAGSTYKSTSDITDWILFGGIIVAAIIVLYGLTRLIRGRGMHG